MKALIILILAAAIFGGGYYATWKLYLKPHEALKEEAQLPPGPPPPDPSLPEFQRVQTMGEGVDRLEERKAWQAFIEHYPSSTRINEARERLGAINSAFYFSRIQTPEKTVYEVKKNDVITRVAERLESTPELIMRSNDLRGIILRIGQKLYVPPANFTLTISLKEKKVFVMQHDRFFKQYDILEMPPHDGKPTPAKPQKLNTKIVDKHAYLADKQIFIDNKEFAQATDFWISIAGRSHNLYTELPEGTPPHKPAGGGYGLALESMRDLYALMRKGDAVTIE